MKHIAIFASGRGSNAEAIIQYFKNHSQIKVSLLLTANPNAGALQVAAEHQVVSVIVSANAFGDEQTMTRILKARDVDYIVLSGFLQLVPAFLIKQFPNRILNIHPALLPNYGGKGMFGMNVHKAVVANREVETGISIHFVNEHYDEGKLILQKMVAIDEQDTAETVALKVQALEHQWYAPTIEATLLAK